uniref:Bromo domain-containing protein n=1 Tax=Macrostomum lignano TaxID=282301 RepID=A0A1I8J3X3_9PLAT
LNLNKMVEPVKLANSSSNTAQGLSARSQPKAKPQFYLVMSEKFSWLEFHQELKCAGLTKKRAAFQTRIGELVEGVAAAVVGISGESYYDWMMTGSFVEGWGNNLFRLDGVTGVDSDIDWSQVVKHKVYHLRSTCHSVVDCINRKDYELKNGHIVVKNSSQQPAFDTKRHGLRPDTDECHAYPCCSYPATVLDDDRLKNPVCDKFQQIIKTQFDNENPIEDALCSGQREASERNPKSEKKIIESVKSYHAKTLLMKLLRDRDSWPENGHDDDVEEDEEASKRLERLVWRGLGFLLRSITTNLQAAEAGEEPSGDSKEPPQSPSRQASVASSSASTKSSNSKVPRVLDHALLKDCGLYLKPKKPKEATKSSKSSSRNKAISAIEAHASALEEMKEDLLGLIGKRGDMDDVLAETPGILWERGSSAVSDLNRELKKLNEPELKMVLEKFEKLTQ